MAETSSEFALRMDIPSGYLGIPGPPEAVPGPDAR